MTPTSIAAALPVLTRTMEWQLPLLRNKKINKLHLLLSFTQSRTVSVELLVFVLTGQYPVHQNSADHKSMAEHLDHK